MKSDLRRVEDIIEKARKGYLGKSDQERELFAVGFLAQSVHQLELDLKRANEKVTQLNKNMEQLWNSLERTS